MIRRHTRTAMVMHWGNALCWIALLCSGFAMLAGHVQPVGRWWCDFWWDTLGQNLLLLGHIGIGLVWSAGCILYVPACWRRDVFPFLREVCVFRRSDVAWCLKKGLWLTMGPKLMTRLGIDPALPPQGFYNAGQRMVAVCAVLASATLMATGLAMTFCSGTGDWSVGPKTLQWLLLIHFCAAGLMAVLLPIHIYMAALAPGEGPALRSMFTGFVPEEHVREHNPLWYENLKRAEKQ